jgi:acid phosphatase
MGPHFQGPAALGRGVFAARRRIRDWALSACLAAAALPLRASQELPARLANGIQHVIVLYTENRSFDSVYGSFPGANGLSNARAEQFRQTDRMGTVLGFLPQPYLSDTTQPDPRFPPAADRDRFGRGFADMAATAPNERYLANRYYDADRFAALDSVSGDMVHRFYTEQYQINRVADPKNAGGAPMSKFVAWSNNPGLVMGAYDVQNLGEARIAKEFVLCDNVFHSAFGGSFLNHFWLVAARTPVWPGFGALPPAQRPVKWTRFDANGYPTANGVELLDEALTNDARLGNFPQSNASRGLGPNDFWAVNTFQPVNGPADDPPSRRLPLQEFDTIGDRMTGAGVTWAWFSGGWNDAKAGRADGLFQYHHQPFAYFRRFALAKAPVEATVTHPGEAGSDSPASARYLKDESDFTAALANGTLPQVSFVKPLGESSGHPGQSSVVSEQEWVAETIGRIQRSPYWASVAVFVIPDENGGLWDHVPPPVIDTWGPGSRVPMVIVSPFARRDYVDHTQYETVSIIRFIELRWNLAPLNDRDAKATAPIGSFLGE